MNWKMAARLPGAGPSKTLNMRSAINASTVLHRSRNVAAGFPVILRRWQSGSLIDPKSGIIMPDGQDVGRAFEEPASAINTSSMGRDPIKAWGLKLAKTKCHARARVRVARKLALGMPTMWRDGTFCVGDPDAEAHEIDIAYAAKMQRLSYARS